MAIRRPAFCPCKWPRSKLPRRRSPPASDQPSAGVLHFDEPLPYVRRAIYTLYMPCNPDVLKDVPLFALLDEEECAVLASQVELKEFVPRQRIYRMSEPGGRAYILVSGSVRVSTIDEDGQEVEVDCPAKGEFFGFASMLDGT